MNTKLEHLQIVEIKKKTTLISFYIITENQAGSGGL